MYRILFGLSFLLLVQVNAGWHGTVKNLSLPSDTTRLQSINIFNGKNLDGWYKFIKGRGRDIDPKNVFTVHDGAIHVTGEEYGCITTESEYDNYKLEVEYKWGERTFAPREGNARDNGVLLHSIGPDGAFDNTWMNSIECQIIEGGTGDFIVVGNGTDSFSITSNVAPEKQSGSNIYSPGGAPVTINSGRINWLARDLAWKDVKDFRGKRDIEKNVGEWNKLECIAKGDQILIILNGTTINNAYNVRPHKGRIQIQSEGAEIFFRKVKRYTL